MQVDDRVEDPALEAALGQFGEEAFDPALTIEPRANLGVLVGGVIVEDNVDDPAGQNVGFDRIEKRMNS